MRLGCQERVAGCHVIIYFIEHIAAACSLAVHHLLPKWSRGVAHSVQRCQAAAARAAAARQRLLLSGAHGRCNQSRVLQPLTPCFAESIRSTRGRWCGGLGR